MASNQVKLWEYIGTSQELWIWRFDRGSSGTCQLEGKIKLYVFGNVRPLPVALGEPCINTWLEPAALVTTRFLGRDYILGQGKVAAEVTGGLDLYLASDAPRWCALCGEILPRCCPTCNRSYEHTCNHPESPEKRHVAP
jgi:hypothetical protein